MSDVEQIREELFLISDEWLEDAEQLRERDKRNSARTREQDATRIRELARSIDAETERDDVEEGSR